MKKYLIALLVLVGAMSAGPVSASLWDFYQEIGLELPPVEERANLYALIADDEYKGLREQNLALEEHLRSEGFHDEPSLGATLPVAGVTYTLSGTGVTASASSITLQSLTIPQTGYALQDSDFSDTFYITLEPGNTKRQEIASCTTVTQNGNGTATLSGCSRGLLPFTPFTASSSYRFAHAGGTAVIFSDPPQLFNEFAAKGNEETVTAVWTYDVYPVASSTLGNATTSLQLLTLGQAQSLTNQGAATATEAIAGISRLSDSTQQASSTFISVDDPLVLQTVNATSSPTMSCDTSGTAGALCLPVAENDGKLNQSWLDLSDNFSWTGTHDFSVTTTLTTTTQAATTVVSSTITNLDLGGENANTLVNGPTSDATSLHTHDGLSGPNASSTQFSYELSTISTDGWSITNATFAEFGGYVTLTSGGAGWEARANLWGTGSASELAFNSGKDISAAFMLQQSNGNTGDRVFGFAENCLNSYNTDTIARVAFGIDGTTLYATTDNGTNGTQLDISSFATVTDWNLYEIRFTHGSLAEFYVNGNFATSTALTLPNTADGADFCAGGTANGEQLRMSNVYITQEL